MQVTASTTAADGSTVQDCARFYIEGPSTAAGGIPNSAITSQLESLYTGSQSYPTDGKATFNLMTGIAWIESSYTQFRTPAENNPDLFSLKSQYGILAKWPYESSGGGKYIGLMQILTGVVQDTDPNAWKWADSVPAVTANANDAVNLFSGTDSPNKMQQALSYEKQVISGDPRAKPQAIDGYWNLTANLDGHQLEDMALVLYGGWLTPCQGSESCILQSQYYIPQCSGTQGTKKSGGQTYLTCSTGWQWTTNTQYQQDGVTYAQDVRTNVQ